MASLTRTVTEVNTSATILRLRETEPAAAAAPAVVAVAENCLSNMQSFALSTPERRDLFKDRAKKFSNCLKAIDALLDIKEGMERNPGKDKLSCTISNWIEDVVDISEAIFASENPETSLLAIDHLEDKINYLAQQILSNHLSLQLIDNPYIEAGTFIWGEHLLNECKKKSDISPFTGQKFNTTPHEAARRVLEWGKSFFPDLFIPGTATPLTNFEYKILTASASSMARKNALEISNSALEKSTRELNRKNHIDARNNYRELMRINRKAEMDIRELGQKECERLRGRILSVEAEFKNSIARLEAELESERRQNTQLLINVHGLRLDINHLEQRMHNANTEIQCLKFWLASAHERIDGLDDGGGCGIM